jgi:hypothetical protein
MHRDGRINLRGVISCGSKRQHLEVIAAFEPICEGRRTNKERSFIPAVSTHRMQIGLLRCYSSHGLRLSGFAQEP